jgi:hypothetical protein
MAIKIKGKRLLLLGLLVVLIIAGVIGAFKLIKNKNSIDEPVELTSSWQKNLEEDQRNSVLSYLDDNEVLKLYDLLQAKEYEKTAESAKIICGNKIDEMQVFCYGYYAKALIELNRLEELAEVSKEALSKETIQKNETAKLTWEYNLSQASKGINPKDTPLGGRGDEARL